MNIIKKINVSLVLSILALASCQRNNTSTVPDFLSDKEIANWNELYPSLLIEAQKWDPSAELWFAVIDINPKKYLVSALFASPQSKFGTLTLEYLADGTIKSEIINQDTSLSNFDSIKDTEWRLNSTDAWDLYVKNPDIISYSSDYFDCAKLILLNKENEIGEKKVVWRLALDNCKQDTIILFHIDANSGDFLEVEKY